MCVCVCLCLNVQTCVRGYIIFNILYSIWWLENLDRYTDPIPACPPSTAAVNMNMSRPTPPPPKGDHPVTLLGKGRGRNQGTCGGLCTTSNLPCHEVCWRECTRHSKMPPDGELTAQKAVVDANIYPLEKVEYINRCDKGMGTE